MTPKIIVITGPTATGKTGLALKMAKEIGGELISADSRQVYKYLDIVTGKDLPKKAEFVIDKKISSQSPKKTNDPKMTVGYYIIDGIPLWLYDLVSPDQYFSSYDWAEVTKPVIDDIAHRGKTPVIVGGSYLYLKHLLYGFDTQGIDPDWKLREELKGKTTKELFDILRSLSVHLSRQMNESDKNNPHRLIRKIEIARARRDGKTPGVKSPQTPGVREEQHYKVDQFIGLRFQNKTGLETAIEKRVEERIKNGALEETRQLLEKGYRQTDPGLQATGYKQLIDHLEGRLTLPEAKKQWVTAELQYASRQYTFMKSDKNITWKDV